jgi:hypothetical protein
VGKSLDKSRPGSRNLEYRPNEAGNGINLLKRSEELQPKKPSVPHNLLPQHSRSDRWRFGWYQARRGRGGRGHRELHDLVLTQQVARRYAGTIGADIERLRELNELHPGRISSPQEDRHLQPDTGGPTLLAILQLPTFLGDVCSHGDVSTVLPN